MLLCSNAVIEYMGIAIDCINSLGTLTTAFFGTVLNRGGDQESS